MEAKEKALTFLRDQITYIVIASDIVEVDKTIWKKLTENEKSALQIYAIKNWKSTIIGDYE